MTQACDRVLITLRVFSDEIGSVASAGRPRQAIEPLSTNGSGRHLSPGEFASKSDKFILAITQPLPGRLC